jgi:hypothetical protein
LELSYLTMFYLATKPSHVGVYVNGLACFPHRPTVYCRHRGDQSFLVGVAMSRHAGLGGGAYPVDVKPPGSGYLTWY